MQAKNITANFSLPIAYNKTEGSVCYNFFSIQELRKVKLNYKSRNSRSEKGKLKRKSSFLSVKN